MTLLEILEIMKQADIWDYHKNGRDMTLSVYIDDIERDHRKIYDLRIGAGYITVELKNLSGYNKEKSRWMLEMPTLNKSGRIESKKGLKALLAYVSEIMMTNQGYFSLNYNYYRKG